jgi:hypothetical protein
VSRTDRGRGGCKICCPGNEDAIFLCGRHRARAKRYGSPTAMGCVTCKAVYDDTDTAALTGAKGWQCRGCAPRYCAYDECSKVVPREHCVGTRQWRYCSPKCQERAANARKAVLAAIRKWGTAEPTPVPCFQCEKPFVPSKTVRGIKLYCSKACLHLADREKQIAAGKRVRKVAYAPRPRVKHAG